ncbi:MAG: IS200/IS605 family transposase [Lentisphaeria bacterium]|jgi:REP element-mobilizing transposase RayT
MANTFTNLLFHIIFSTKNREPVIAPEFRPELFAYIGGIIRAENGILLAAGGMFDHVHLLAKLPPAMAVAEMVRHIKGGSSTWINEEKRVIGHFAWQAGYGAFSVSESATANVKTYIENQQEHHKVCSFQEEFVAFLKKHGISYDERYIWG